MKFGVGQPVLRIEDSRLITGQGRYTDDIEPGTGLGVAFLRSPLAHALLLSRSIPAPPRPWMACC